jgi:hypothetical protein
MSTATLESIGTSDFASGRAQNVLKKNPSQSVDVAGSVSKLRGLRTGCLSQDSAAGAKKKQHSDETGG